MDISGILAIGGYPGLFKMVSQMKSGLVVESLLDGKRMPAYATHKILALEDISIYTEEEDVPLSEVFGLLFKVNNGKPSVNPKKASIAELQDALAQALPNYDRDRVYNSDLKKLFQWYNLLAEKGLLKEEKAEEEAEKPKEKETKKKASKKAK